MSILFIFYVKYVRFLFLLLSLCVFVINNHHNYCYCYGNNHIESSSLLSVPSIVQSEIKLINKLPILLAIPNTNNNKHNNNHVINHNNHKNHDNDGTNNATLNRIFFWRPQKVGSSTMLSLLLSYSYRYFVVTRRKGIANGYCIKLAKCLITGEASFDPVKSISNNNVIGKYVNKDTNNGLINELQRHKYTPRIIEDAVTSNKEHYAERTRYHMITSHNICNMPSHLILAAMHCGFESSNNFNAKEAKQHPQVRNIKEIFIVRDPLNRAISIYYFWGELYKLKAIDGPVKEKGGRRKRRNRNNNNSNKSRLGQSSVANEVEGRLFTYHGNESTAPPYEIAQAYASGLPLSKGMPGPSFTWSAFSDNLQDALQIVDSDRMITIVTERLDESLVAARHYLGWSLADVVVVSHRKALSTHPKHTAWPLDAVEKMKQRLKDTGEYEMYDHATRKLDDRLAKLLLSGVNIEQEVELLKLLRARVSQLCFQDDYLERYKNHLNAAGLLAHRGNNKLRDASNEFVDNGHAFSWNGELLFSYDVCGHCEAHALMLGIDITRTQVINSDNELKPLIDLDHDALRSNVNFVNCPLRS